MAGGCINTQMARLLGAPPLLDIFILFTTDAVAVLTDI